MCPRTIRSCRQRYRWCLQKNATQTAVASLAAHHVLVQPRQPRRPRERQRRLDHIASVVHLPNIGRRLIAGVFDAPAQFVPNLPEPVVVECPHALQQLAVVQMLRPNNA